MADIKLDGYGTLATVLSTELDSLANGAYSSASGAIDNTTDLALYDDLELNLDLTATPTANSVVEVFLVPSVDGTNYADSGTPARNLLAGAFILQATSAAQRLAVRGVPLPPGLFKYVARNNCGQAFPASGTTIKRRPYNLQVG
jgi:hypothetical protein